VSRFRRRFVAHTLSNGREYADLVVVTLSGYSRGYRTAAAAEMYAAFRVVLTMDEEAVWTAVTGLYGVMGSYLA